MFSLPPVLFPLKIYNGEGVSLQERLKENKVATFRGTCVQDFPNYVSAPKRISFSDRLLILFSLSAPQFWLMGPNT